MRLRIALAALAAAFFFAAALATMTTLREVRIHISSVSQPVSRL